MCNLAFSIGKVKTVDFSHVRDLKVGIVSIGGQGHFLPFAHGRLHMKIKICFSQKPPGHFQPNFVCKLLSTRK